MFGRIALLIGPLFCVAASNLPPEADRRLAHNIYREVIEIKSGYSTGSTTVVDDGRPLRLQRI